MYIFVVVLTTAKLQDQTIKESFAYQNKNLVTWKKRVSFNKVKTDLKREK
jgi:hypothetical protein